MFNEVNPFEAQIRFLLEDFSMEELFDMMDISCEQVLTILLQEGHIELPPFLDNKEEEQDKEYLDNE